MGSYGVDNNVHYLGNEPIAIVGSSCRFPGGATSPSNLWELLQKPRDILQRIPSTRFSTKAFYHSNSQHHGSMNVEHAYLLEEDPRMFDRDFFSINPKEAEAMDPQQRTLLETVYEGIESTGYSMQQLRGSRTAVFVGCMSYDYHFTAIRGIDSLPQYHATGTAASILANRVSYFYDWRGPSVSIDTACSSSLVAVHQAVSALRNREANMAVAAGSNLILGPEPFVSESKLNMLSPNGRSWMWDASADGYTRGEGFGAVFLKTLSQAIADGDHIEAIIRETGVNSDGKTPGITMPSADSQAQLIRDTYARAGLDPTRESDRPQYFEAHGTGTQAGDPIEARAIQSVFFPDKGDGKLIVGSIKTVIGHTEGTAGVAGVLKASLAIQHSQIPANLHFKRLNSKIQPYYAHLCIPTEMVAWPDVPRGGPRRVSVNSFGFGGTNAHAIIESFEGSPCNMSRYVPNGDASAQTQPAQFPGPFVLSANSGSALAMSAGTLAGYLRAHPDTDLKRLAYTLFRKADFPVRAAFSATSVGQLADKLDAAKDSLKASSRNAIIPKELPVRILGVFTGQGAQWATMGKELFHSSDVFRRTIELMQESLDTLPKRDQPDWTIVYQLNAPAESSRISEAIVSQPLCTALQVALVDVLHVAGIKFSAVVGHSSGEIGAAYAAGYLTAADAIRIAYYRGLHARLAQGPESKRGKMMAVGMSPEQAKSFCVGFNGALTVAASNSQTSCTLAGDAEAIDVAFAQLQQDGTFARVLQVDTAYHSHHMKACGDPYLESMRHCGVQVQAGDKHCRWYSSVWGLEGRKRSFNHACRHLLEGEYWVQNMTGTVLFDQAVARALNEDQYLDVVLEVGPHPALKGPSSETIKSLTEMSLPYFGLLKRGQNAAESFASALGLLWQHFPSTQPILSFDAIHRALSNGRPQKLTILKSLPTYSWDRPGLIWKESRASRLFRTQSQPLHELLGHAVTHGERDKREVHWKQVLRLSELPWLTGHKIQGEVLFPASGYLSMAYEAAVRLVDDQASLKLVELHDINIVRAMRLEEDSSGLEAVFSTRVTSQSDECITAEVACYSGAVDAGKPLGTSAANLTAHFTGGVRLWLGQSDGKILPHRVEPLLPMDELDMGRLYSSLAKEGFNYEGFFQAKSMVRRLNRAVVAVSSTPEESSIRACIHPTVVDTAFQGLLAAFSFPEDGRLGSIYLPTRVDCVRISMAPSKPLSSGLRADVTVTSADKYGITGDLDLFDESDAQIEVQIRGVHLTPVGQRRDSWLYAGVKWERDATFGLPPGVGSRLTDEEHVLYERLIRTAYYYIRQLRKKILPQELLLMGKYRKHMMTWVTKHLLPQIEAGENPDIRPEWKDDTLEMIEQWRTSYPPDNNDMNILHAMGKNLVQIVRGTLPPLRILTQDNMLDRLYVEGIGVKHGNVDLGVVVKQLAHQYPQMKLVEVGAGTGGTTRTVLDALQNQYASYTYTDISTGFFEIARSKFAQHINRLTFKTLNIENDPVGQGFADGTFDMVVSSNCLHATKSLGETLAHCRKLLRPGGRLVLLEVTRDFLSTQLIMSTLPGWFLGIEDGRVWAPTVSVERWDELLRKSGFSGVDISSSPSYCSVIVAQAVDQTVETLRRPLAATSVLTVPRNIIIVGSGASSELAARTQTVLTTALPTKDTNITVVSGLEAIQIPTGATLLSLGDLDKPIFTHITEENFKGLQETMAGANSVLWVTAGAKSGRNPDANLMPGLSSALLAEHRNLKLQFLDIDNPSSVDPSMLAEMLLRLSIHDPAKADNLLWNQEPELALKDGALYIPRYQALDEINRRSAARLRRVNQTVDPKSNATAIGYDESQGAFEIQTAFNNNTVNNTLVLNATATSLCAATIEGCGKKYICICRDSVTGGKILALVDVLGSLVQVPSEHILHRWQDEKTFTGDAAFLSVYLGRAIAENFLSNLKGPIWIHGAPKDLSEAIRVIAAETSTDVLQTTSDFNSNVESNFIHPYAGKDTLHKLIPKDLVSFVNASNSQQNALSKLFQDSLPRSAIVKEGLNGITTSLSLRKLRRLAGTILTSSIDGSSVTNVIPVEEITRAKKEQLGLTAVVDWTTAGTLNALVQPLNHKELFSHNKTYFLCGMTGDLGISVALWMAENGAKNIVLTSRNPNVSGAVLEILSQKGATVRPMAVDLTNMDSLRSVYAEIKAIMPPVGGVMNAAMVLRDRLFQTLPWEDFSAVLAPKVTGSKNLNELFGNEKLDFFVCFSSTTSIVGSIGQSAYAAANHYMASLVHGRHQRGLAGSVIYISILTGFGYIFRRQSDHADTIYKSILPRCERQSETDLHEMLAEAIVCGRPGPNQIAELITGIRPIFTEEWREDPRLSCYKNQQQLDQEAPGESAAGTVSAQEQLASSEHPAECLNILLKCFAQALGNLLELDPEQLDANTPVAALGIDSLVAIRIREWFLRELDVDVPVLKVMSDNYSMSRLCDDVLVDWRRLNTT